MGGRRAADILRRLQGAAGEDRDLPPDGGEVDLAVGALEQGDAEFLLQLLDLAGERRLADMAALGGVTEMLQLGHRGQIVQVAQIHGGRSIY